MEYLLDSTGMLSFWIGDGTILMLRPENEQSYDIAMHQLFINEDAFNIYNETYP